MKRFIALILILISCKGTQLDNEPKSQKVDFFKEINAKVYKIDSIRDYYVIYASNERINYKIISKKVNEQFCEELKENSFYNFKVKSLFLEKIKLGNDSDSLQAINYLDITRCVVKVDTEFCTEPGVIDICESPNMLGLCYRKIAN
ncbi:hypothetical protein [Hanstruepera ponticola]|uniref:hypothetical protein n=1 Tax=Hanstruepera ponticola TaxID=2042995 RepID=UPI00178636FC|nr:hypothetical protein [Hanstruepera ponticola]